MGMKCIRCGADNNQRDRTNHAGRCKNCNHPFVFDPAIVTDKRFKFTDQFFQKAIEDISANHTLFFTPKQLWNLLDRRLSNKWDPIKALFSSVNNSAIFLFLFCIGFFLTHSSNYPVYVPMFSIIFLLIAGKIFEQKSIQITSRKSPIQAKYFLLGGYSILLLGMVAGIFLAKPIIFFLGTGAGLGLLFFGNRKLSEKIIGSQPFLVESNLFQEWLDRWQQINDPLSKMLPSPRQESLPGTVSPDITAYSFDRAVICDRAEVAQLLIANNFHFENNCAILSITGYPQSIFATVMEMLKRNENLKVYALHDASPHGVRLVHTLRTNRHWFQDSNIIIYDLGLLPRQVLASRDLLIRNSEASAREASQLPPEVRQSLSDTERVWLETGNFVELESFSPQRILNVLNQGIARSQETTSNDSVIWIDSGIESDSSRSIYISESFG